MSTPIDIQTLLGEGTCYTCFAPTPVPEIAILSLWGRIAGGGGGAPCVPLAAPVATDATAITANGFTANWTAVPGAVTYYLDASTDPLFGSFLLGYNGLAVAAPATSSAVIQIARPDCYYRVRASALPAGDLSCSSVNSNAITCFAMVGFNSLASFISASTVAASFSTAAYQPTANALVLAFVTTINVPSSVTGNGLTWVLVKQLPQNIGGASGLQSFVYRAMGAAPTNTALTVAVAASNAGCLIHVQEYTHVYTGGTNGSGAINQFMITSSLATGGIQPLDANGLNASVGMAFGAATPTGAVLEGGWTEDYNNSQGTVPNSCMFVAHQLVSTDNTFTTSMAGNTSTWMAEIRSANSGALVLLSPTTIANLEVYTNSSTGVYQDAGKTVPCTANGDLLFTWDNQGNTAVVADFLQAVAGSRPIYNATGGINSKPRISFSSKKMTVACGTFAQPFTLIALGNYTGNVGTFGTYFWSADDLIEIGVDATSSNQPFVYAGTGRHGSIPIDATPSLQAYTMNGVSWQLLVNGVPCGETGTVGAAALNTSLTIGGNVASSLFLIGDFYEEMLFSRVLTTAELCTIQNYIKGTYALSF